MTVLKQYSDRTQTMLNTAQYLTNNSVTTHEFTQNSTHKFTQHSTHVVRVFQSLMNQL